MWKLKEWWYIQLTLGIGCGHLTQHPLPRASHQPHLLISSAQPINQKKTKSPEMRLNSKQIVSYCLGLCTQNPGLREADLEHSPERGSDKINIWSSRSLYFKELPNQISHKSTKVDPNRPSRTWKKSDLISNEPMKWYFLFQHGSSYSTS